MKPNEIVAPEGMSGLAVAPWTPGEIYAVAANWAQAGTPVMTYGKNGWTPDQHSRQVADFRHNPLDALESEIHEAIQESGETPDADDVEDIVSNAVSIRTFEFGAMCDALERHGDRFAGNHVEDSAQDWIDQGFAADDIGPWCEIGVWDAATAAAFRDAGKTPDQIARAAKSLVEQAGDNVTNTYTDGCPIYSTCNNDTPPDVVIDECE